jgi:hypothetical protein
MLEKFNGKTKENPYQRSGNLPYSVQSGLIKTIDS